jgi:hypothetical protein
VAVAVSNINRLVFVMETHCVANYVFLSSQQSSGQSHIKIANKCFENMTVRSEIFGKYAIT